MNIIKSLYLYNNYSKHQTKELFILKFFKKNFTPSSSSGDGKKKKLLTKFYM